MVLKTEKKPNKNYAVLHEKITNREMIFNPKLSFKLVIENKQ